MRHLIDTYIEADEPRTISPFDGMSLLDLIVKTGIANCDCHPTWQPQGQKKRHCRNDREQIKRALYDVLQDVTEVERIFLIVKAQTEY